MTLDVSNLQISLEERERWRRSLSVTVPASVVQQEERRAAARVASRAKVKGFRKGRVPAKLIESRLGGSLRQETLDKLIGEAYRTALQAHELRPISEGEISALTYEPDSDLVFSIEFDVEPLIELPRLGGFAVERPVAEVQEETVTQVLDRLREQQGAWKPVEGGTPVHRDLVSVRIMRLDDDDVTEEGKEYEFVLGQGDALPDIEAGIMTLEVGGSGEFDITFPETFPDESRRGESERVRVDLLGRKELELPEPDDDFARQVGDFETLDALLARIREDLEKDAREHANSVVRGRLLDLIIDANPFEVPVSMVDRYVDGVIGEEHGMDAERLEEVRGSIRPEAERAVKRILVIEQVARLHGLAATDDDLDERIEKIAEANNSTASQVYAQLQKSGRLEQLEREITERKVFEHLMAESEITDAAVS